MSDRDDEFMGDEEKDPFTGFGIEDEDEEFPGDEELDEEEELDASGMHIEEDDFGSSESSEEM